jgi:hypothetical protein
LIPDDEPGAGRYVTLKDVKQIIGPHMQPSSFDEAVQTLLDQGWVAISGKGGFMIRFSMVGQGLYNIMLKESDPDVC